MDPELQNAIRAGLTSGAVIPYLGPGVLALADGPPAIPATPELLVGRLTAKTTVPHKIRNNLTATAQFIENFKHRKTVSAAMTEAFSPALERAPSALHRFLADGPALPLWVNAWYDDLPQRALAGRARSWGMAQGVSHAEHPGDWVHWFDAEGSRVAGADPETSAAAWETLLYQPLGSIAPAANFLVSDSDYVEVLTEIDIQTPIPKAVQRLRSGRSFLFLGCRFATQLERIFAQQILKRSADEHWSVLPEEPTRNERRFLERHGIRRIDTPLREWVSTLVTPRFASSACR